MLCMACAQISMPRSRTPCVLCYVPPGNRVDSANTDEVRDSWGGALLIASPTQTASSSVGSVRIAESIFTNNTAQVSTCWHDACICAGLCASLSLSLSLSLPLSVQARARAHGCMHACLCRAHVALASLHMHAPDAILNMHLPYLV